MKKRRIAAVICSLVLAVTIFTPTASFGATNGTLPDLMDKTTYRIPDDMNYAHWCMTYANMYLLQRKLVMMGSLQWNSFRAEDIRSMTEYGRPYSYTVDGITMNVIRDKKVMVDMTTEERGELLRGFLADHPEGVIVYGAHAQTDGDAHAVLLTSYENGQFYCVDSVRNRGKKNGVPKNAGVEPLSTSTIETLDRVTWYLYIDSFSGEAETVPVEVLKASNCVYPTNIVMGSAFTIKGTVISGSLLSNVEVAVFDEYGNKVISESANPRSAKYSIAPLDNRVKFGTLSEGTYQYQIIATNATETKVVLDKTFTVTAPKSTLKVSKYNYPKTIKKGKMFTIKGKITSNYTITSVTGTIKTAGGKVKQTYTVDTNSKSVSILKTLDPKIKFGKLKKGKYYYVVSATDKKKTKTLIKRKFTVK